MFYREPDAMVNIATLLGGLGGIGLLGATTLVYRAMTRYDWPAFVRRDIPLSGGIPVLMYHDVSESSFRDDLEYLHRCKYTTITLSELECFLSGGTISPENPIVLTFDDGLYSTVKVALPLLQEYGARASCFITPGLVPRDADRRNISLPANTLATQSELSRLWQSGLFEMGSHTYDHRLIYIKSDVTEFYGSDCQTFAYGHSVPLPNSSDPVANPAWQPRPRRGQPIYPYRSGMCSAPRFIESAEVTNACVEYATSKRIAALGADEYQAEMRDFYESLLAKGGGCVGRLESIDEQYERIRRSLTVSKQLIEDWTGKPCTWLCYPYNESSALANTIAREAGYHGAFVGSSGSPYPYIRPGHDPYHINRISSRIGRISAVKSLPGPGRRSLPGTILHSTVSHFI